VTAVYIRFHRWQGFALTNLEPDLFSYVFKVGFCTIYVCKQCLLEAYRKLRRTIERAVDDTEGR
jgi:hypothetical protein